MMELARGNELSLEEAITQIDCINNELEASILEQFIYHDQIKLPANIPLGKVKELWYKKDYFCWKYIKNVRPLDLKDYKCVRNSIYKIDSKNVTKKAHIHGILRILADKGAYAHRIKLMRHLLKKIIIDFEAVANFIESSSAKEGTQIGFMLANYYTAELEMEIYSIFCSNTTYKKKRVLQIIQLGKLRKQFLEYEEFDILLLLYSLKKISCLDLIWRKNI